MVSFQLFTIIYLFIYFNIIILLIQSFENYNIKLYQYYCQGCFSHVMYTHTTRTVRF
jgi:hypothetical protein